MNVNKMVNLIIDVLFVLTSCGYEYKLQHTDAARCALFNSASLKACEISLNFTKSM